ncbi:hypothetical protein ACP3VS_18660 [Lysinibacillus sp. VIII_CA]|uniref:hypothetical protein n=1 Tax=Lysinibacillus TaxID=400634 RepID=UPI0018CED1D3|nr:hypothetical protein [Lysinibacillus sphaericus]MBG9689671.1 hypothetical protein [Lysinibacillus sphaericus]
MTTIENDIIRELGDAYRMQSVVYGIVRGLTKRKMPVMEGDKLVSKEVDVFQVILPGNVTGYCPVSEFRYTQLNPRDYANHVGRKEPFIIQGLDEENQIAVISCVAALRKKADAFWLSIQNTPDEEIFDTPVVVDIVHYNTEKRMIYAFLEGQVCFMYPRDWNWSERGALDVQNGERVEVKIVQLDREMRRIRLSRKAALPDPFEFISDLKLGDSIAGKVSAIHPVHGIWVRFDNEAELKGIVPRTLENPSVGDIVSCRIQQLNVEERRGKVLITGYPNGKKRNQDITAFLYGNE